MLSQSPTIQNAIRYGEIFQDPTLMKNDEIEKHMVKQLAKDDLHNFRSFSNVIQGWKIFYNMRKGDRVVMYHVYNKRADGAKFYVVGEVLDDKAEMVAPKSVGALDHMWFQINSKQELEDISFLVTPVRLRSLLKSTLRGSGFTNGPRSSSTNHRCRYGEFAGHMSAITKS